MRLIATFGLFAVLSAALWPQTVFAGAWTVKKGGMYNKVYVNSFSTTENFNKNGDKEPMSNNGEFTDTNLVYYEEYGLKDNITLFTSVPYKQIKYEDDSIINKTNGIGDIDLGVRYRLLNKSFILSAQGLVKIPSAYDKNVAMPLGNGQTDVEFRLLFGKSLYPLPMYFGLELGYRYRADAPSDEYKYLIELGGDLTKSVYLRTKLDGTKSVNNGGDVVDFAGNPVATIEYDLAKLELTAGFRFSSFWFGEFTYTPNVYGKRTAGGSNLSLAVIYAF